ncbi:tetratricopeptide repeat protein [Sulfurimonas sp.]|uniref:tetratricopeptide repeat protein n=1 Tax=Sulfurimonas sp. TaxID=2022749 RepID=UPI002B46B75D|nr:tetratricopeptide repeat protein [Sulfurimonas sp.]
MKYKLLKLLFLAFLFIGQSAYAIEPLSIKYVDPKASEKADSLYNKAQRLYAQKKYQEAILLYEESYEYKPSKDIPANTGISYKHIGEYDKACSWYEIGVKKFNDNKSALNLALLYEEKLNDIDKSIMWYLTSIKLGNIDARKGLGLLYHQQKDKLNSATYMIGMIGHPYTKERVLGLLRNDWKIDEPTLKKAYELQKTLVPNPYTGGID